MSIKLNEEIAAGGFRVVFTGARGATLIGDVLGKRGAPLVNTYAMHRVGSSTIGIVRGGRTTTVSL